MCSPILWFFKPKICLSMSFPKSLQNQAFLSLLIMSYCRGAEKPFPHLRFLAEAGMEWKCLLEEEDWDRCAWWMGGNDPTVSGWMAVRRGGRGYSAGWHESSRSRTFCKTENDRWEVIKGSREVTNPTFFFFFLMPAPAVQESSRAGDWIQAAAMTHPHCSRSTWDPLAHCSRPGIELACPWRPVLSHLMRQMMVDLEIE